MNRFRISELSVARLYHAAIRRIQDFPHAVAWVGPSGFSEINKARLATFKDKHLHRRCFIMGNGPSLAKMDLRPLETEITFGLNRIYLLFDRLPFIPTYYVSINELVLEQFGRDIQALSMPKFLNWNRRTLFGRHDSKTMFVRIAFKFFDTFGTDLRFPLSGGATVTYIAMQIAYFMGFDEVILIGVDHDFVDKGTPNVIALRDQLQDKNHFHPDYFPRGTLWQLPDLIHSEAAYALARRSFEKANRRILDATVNGKCPVFQRVDYWSLF